MIGFRDLALMNLELMKDTNGDLEKVFLGTLLLRPLLKEVVTIVSDNDFQKTENMKIYAVMMAMGLNNKPHDLITVTDALHKSGQLEKIGTAHYVASLTEILPLTKEELVNVARSIHERSETARRADEEMRQALANLMATNNQ